MMYKSRLITVLLFFSIAFIYTATAQKITYTEPDKNEPNKTNFEILGRYNGNYLIYKNYRSATYISVYDANMKLKENVALEFMPERIIEADMVTYPDFTYLFYQFQKKSIVYSMVVKIGPDGKNLSQPIELDTTAVGLGNSGRIYSILPSEDKQKILVFKVNSRDEKKYVFKTLLYDKDLTPLHNSRLLLRMNDRNDFLTDFNMDNDGNLVFGRGIRAGSGENINRFFLVIKPAVADSFAFSELRLDNISMDEVKLRMDNTNNRYLFTGFYYKGKRNGAIEGISNAIYDKAARDWVIKNVIPLGKELRDDARGENNIKNAFDDYYIRQIVIKKDGGFVVAAESIYQTSRGGSNGFNRWDNFYGSYGNSFDYYRYGGYSPYGYNRWGGFSNQTRYHADNVMVAAFDKEGKLTMSNFVRKSQYDDENESMVSYQVINTGNALSFLYNDYEKRDVVLSYQTIAADGKVTRPPTLKSLDKGYSFFPRFAKQVSSTVVIVPCAYRNYLTFAKLDFAAN